MFISKEKNTANYLLTAVSGFFAVADDFFTLKIPGLGIVQDLFQAYTQLIFLFKYLIKAAHQYKKLRKIFPAAVGLTSFSALSDTLMSWQNWESTLILHQVGVVLED